MRRFFVTEWTDSPFTVPNFVNEGTVEVGKLSMTSHPGPRWIATPTKGAMLALGPCMLPIYSRGVESAIKGDHKLPSRTEVWASNDVGWQSLVPSREFSRRGNALVLYVRVISLDAEA